MTTYQQAVVDGSKIFYREAGPKDGPVVLLLHGFPTSSHMFRNLISALADRYHLVAPDLPGFGFSDAPDRKQFRYSFENLAKVIDRFTQAIGIDRYAIYVFDYGAPVGLRLAVAHPERITAIISQNGNAYEEGLSQGWNPIQNYWKQPTAENRSALREFLTPEATKSQYLYAVQNATLVGLATTRFSWTYFWIMPATSHSIPSSRSTCVQNVRRCWRFGARMIRFSYLQAPKPSHATTHKQKSVFTTPAISLWKHTTGKSPVRFRSSLPAISRLKLKSHKPR